MFVLSAADVIGESIARLFPTYPQFMTWAMLGAEAAGPRVRGRWLRLVAVVCEYRKLSPLPLTHIPLVPNTFTCTLLGLDSAEHHNLGVHPPSRKWSRF